jgi:hypothetical protein
LTLWRQRLGRGLWQTRSAVLPPATSHGANGMNRIARLREAMPILRDHVRRGDYDAVEVALAQLTPFQRQLLGARLCLKIAWSYPRRWLLDARFGVHSSLVLLRWAMFWSWLRLRRINFGLLIFDVTEWRSRCGVCITLKEWCYAALRRTQSHCYESLRYATKCYNELTAGISARQRKTAKDN